MQLKASGRQSDDHSADARDSGVRSGNGREDPAGTVEFDPIPPQGLDIASLARGLTTSADEPRAAGGDTPHLAVGLYRRHLGIGANAGYFTLKMMLVRALRRGLKSAVIEVDDAEGEPPEGAVFEISLDPPDAQALARASRTVQRVLRARRWQNGLIR